jgi:tRNA C32,U32 (ribose-2'-O)-methylase TrmJ
MSSPCSIDALEGFYAHLEAALIDIGYLNPDRPKRLMRRLRRLFNRIHPERSEINILRGILRAAQRAAKKLS